MPTFFRLSLVLFALAACAPKPPSVVVPQKPRSLTVQFEGGENLNPAVNGAAAPVEVRVFLLSDEEEFLSAGYFDLLGEPEQILSGALVTEERLFVEPSSDVQFKHSLENDVTHLGIVVGFRNYDDGTWRVSVPISKRRIGGMRRNFLLDGSDITLRMEK